MTTSPSTAAAVTHAGAGVDRSVLKRDKPGDPREIHASPRLSGFVTLAAQLAIVFLVFRIYRLEKPEFLTLAGIVFGAFAVHYWLPFRWKEPFWVAVSVAGSFALVPRHVAELIAVVGFALYGVFRLPIAYRWRLLAVSAIFAVLMFGNATRSLRIPPGFYAVFGAIFMFRVIIYAYDMAHARQPPALIPFLSYFFVLPNYYFLLFPPIDFQTMRKTYYQRDFHQIAQQGIHWIARGTIQLMLYRVFAYWNDSFIPDRVTSLGAVISTMVLTYLLLLNVTGQFHIIAGMLHLFGYDLPETNHRYLLASSFTDFWRRASIYWKDFMVKVVYFPVYFRFRKSGEFRAKTVATIAVFFTTWVLHAYQFFWLRGQLSFSWPDTIFWSALGSLVLFNVLREGNGPRRRNSSWQWAIHAMKVAGTFCTMVVLWSIWTAPSLGEWGYLVTHWMHPGQ